MQDQCLFCLETVNGEKHTSSICSCQLSYHTPCYDRWNKLKPNTCPICRKTHPHMPYVNEKTTLLYHDNDTVSSTHNIFSRRNTQLHPHVINNSEYEAEQQRTKKIFRILLGFVVIILVCVITIIVCG